jgi:DNA-binding CsgD family transcriptional regulator
VADAPITLATPHAFNHLTASLLVSVKHAAVSHGRDTARVRLASEDELVALIDRGAGQGWHSTRETNNDEVRALTEALRTLSARDAQIARLIGIHEMTVRDVAERLGIGASTVHDVWSRVQRTISVEVERVLSGDVCRQAGPHLALIGIQYRSDRAGHEDTTLGELVGVDTAKRLVSHVFGSGELVGGCPACRCAIARQRQVLHQGLPVPVVALAGAESTDGMRELVARVWNATTTSVARMADAIWGLVTINPLPGTAGVATTTVGIGASKIAAVVAASALFTTTPALMSAERSSVRDGQTPPARTTSQTVTSQPSTTTRKTAATPVERSRIARSSTVTPSAPSAPSRSPAPSAPVSARSSQPAVSGAGRASAEFSPGP